MFQQSCGFLLLVCGVLVLQCLPCFGVDVVYDFLGHFVFVSEVLEGGVFLLQFVPVLCQVAQVGVYEYALRNDLAVQRGVPGCVQWHKVVGHDAATAIHRASFPEGLELERVGEVYAVGIGQFAMVEAVNHIHAVFLFLALFVGFLDASSAGGVVFGDGKAYHAAIGQVHRPLYKTFAEGASAHNQTSVLVLYGTCQNLGG